MMDKLNLQNNLKILPAKERLALLLSDKSVDWEQYGIPKSTIRSIRNENKDWDADIISRVHEIQMILMDDFIAFCKKNNLKCIAMYGTLLGAVRHGGLIPGDDDVDVALLRDDYDKMMDLLKNAEANGHAGGEGELFSKGVFLQTTWNDDCFYGGYIKLRYTNSTAIFPQDWWVNCNQGICIDIFPLDSGYKSQVREWLNNQKICILQRMIFAKVYGKFPRFQDMPLLIFKAYKYFGKLFSKKSLITALEKAIKSGDKPDYKSKKQPFGVYGQYTKGQGPRKMPIGAFETLTTLNYEGRIIYAPSGYVNCLRKIYGDMYMILNQVEYGKQRHGFYVPDISFTIYQERMRELFGSSLSGKKIVLFGDETFVSYYARMYGEYIPDVIVDSGVRNVEEERTFIESLKIIEEEEGLDVGTIYKDVCPSQELRLNQMNLENPYSYVKSEKYYSDVRTVLADDFFAMNSDFEEYYFVVCSLYIRETEEKLKSFGVRDYHIFVPNFYRDVIRYENPQYGLLYTNVG